MGSLNINMLIFFTYIYIYIHGYVIFFVFMCTQNIYVHIFVFMCTTYLFFHQDRMATGRCDLSNTGDTQSESHQGFLWPKFLVITCIGWEVF